MFLGEIPERSCLALLGRRAWQRPRLQEWLTLAVTKINHFYNGSEKIRFGIDHGHSRSLITILHVLMSQRQGMARSSIAGTRSRTPSYLGDVSW